jgi:beta-lactam-binding protein with PASTA domain
MSLFKFIFSKAFVKQLVLAAVLLLVLVFLILSWLKFTTNHNQHIVVPDVSKLTYDQATKKLKEVDLSLPLCDF